MFVLNNVVKRYARHGKEVLAFCAESLSIASGSYTAVVGPSGSGKTTLLLMLGGMLSPSAGQILFGGDSLYDLPVARRTCLRREKIGFVFQTFNLVPYLSALENVQLPMSLTGMSSSEQRGRASDLLRRVGLGERLENKPRELSTGQQQRVAFARTLANDPAVILADEPTGNLDPASRAAVLDFFDELHAAGRTVVVVTHDPTAAKRAGSLLCLNEGRIVPHGAGNELRAA